MAGFAIGPKLPLGYPGALVGYPGALVKDPCMDDQNYADIRKDTKKLKR